jgi:DNA modification methylase
VTPYFQNDTATIYCGDAVDVLDVVKRKSIGLVLTDPPYAAGASKGEWRVTASVAIGLSNAAKTVSDGGAMLCFSTSSGRGVDFTIGAVGKTLNLNRILTWHKTTVRSRVAGPWRWDSVLILGFGRSCFGQAVHSSVFMSEGKASKREKDEIQHPAELPDGIADWLSEPFFALAGTVLDPFCGTGQLLIPAYRAGVKVIGIELEERYAEIAAKRLSQILVATL